MEQQMKPDESTDGDLTSLNWLTDFDHLAMKILNQFTDDEEVNNKKNTTPEKSKDNDLSQTKAKKPRNIKPIQTRLQNQTPKDRFETFLSKVREDIEIFRKSEHIYKVDSNLKPPFYFYRLIGMAFVDTGKQLTLKQICSWIKLKFAYFRNSTKWNNSIRHNLSLHPYFCNMGRNKDQMDKDRGGYWKLGIDPKKLYKKRIRNRKSTNNSSNPNEVSLKTDSNINKNKNLTIKGDKETSNDITINIENVLETLCPNDDIMDSEENMYNYVSMEDDTENLKKDVSLNALLPNKDLEDNMPKSEEDKNINKVITSSFSSPKSDRNSLPSVDITIDQSLMDNVNQLLTTCEPFQPYLNDCSLSQTSQLLSQLERIESDISSSDISMSSSTLMAQQKVPLYPLTDTVHNLNGQLLADGNSDKDANVTILTPLASSPSSSVRAVHVTKIKKRPKIKKNNDLLVQTKIDSIIENSTAKKLIIPVEYNMKNASIADNTNNIKNFTSATLSPSLPSSMPFLYPTITATVRDIDYQNTYKPYIDNIDEEFYYFPNIDNRSDDILENFFGISSHDF